MKITLRLARRIGLCLAVAAAISLLAAPPANAQAAGSGASPAVTAPAAPAPCKLDLSALEKAESCSEPAGAALQPQAWVEKASKKLGFCHCGCSSVPTCRTSADCGGASCDRFISCC